jgi:hypothetical protein
MAALPGLGILTRGAGMATDSEDSGLFSRARGPHLYQRGRHVYDAQSVVDAARGGGCHCGRLKQFVSVIELQDKVGARIANLLGSESAMVTSGAAGALTCGTAACVTGTDKSAILQLPDVTGSRVR